VKTSDQTQHINNFGLGAAPLEKDKTIMSNSHSTGTLLQLPEIKGTPSFTLNSTSKKSSIINAGASSL